MDVTFLTEYMNPVIMGVCLCVGYIIKHWSPADNRVIPTAMLVLGAVLAVVYGWPAVTLDVVLGGMVSGLASTGLHQAAKSLFGGE